MVVHKCLFVAILRASFGGTYMARIITSHLGPTIHTPQMYSDLVFNCEAVIDSWIKIEIPPPLVFSLVMANWCHLSIFFLTSSFLSHVSVMIAISQLRSLRTLMRSSCLFRILLTLAMRVTTALLDVSLVV